MLKRAFLRCRYRLTPRNCFEDVLEVSAKFPVTRVGSVVRAGCELIGGQQCLFWRGVLIFSAGIYSTSLLVTESAPNHERVEVVMKRKFTFETHATTDNFMSSETINSQPRPGV